MQKNNIFAMIVVLGLGFAVFRLLGVIIACFLFVPRKYARWVWITPVVILCTFAVVDYSGYTKTVRVVRLADELGSVRDVPSSIQSSQPFVIAASFDPNEADAIDNQRLAGSYRAIYTVTDECERRQIAWIHGNSGSYSSLVRKIAAGKNGPCGLVTVETHVQMSKYLGVFGPNSTGLQALKLLSNGQDLPTLRLSRDLIYASSEMADGWPNRYILLEAIFWGCLGLLCVAFFYIGNLKGIKILLKR